MPYFILKHKIGHNTIILFHQKKNHLQKTKLENVLIKTLYFPLKNMEMRWAEDSKWDWKRDFLDLGLHEYISYIH